MGVEFQTHPIMNIKRNIIFALESRKKNGVPIVENVHLINPVLSVHTDDAGLFVYYFIIVFVTYF